MDVGHKFLKLWRDCAVLPMQVIHERRTLFNCRNAWDIAKFLADATPEDVDLHLFNLRSAPKRNCPMPDLLLTAVSARIREITSACCQPAVCRDCEAPVHVWTGHACLIALPL